MKNLLLRSILLFSLLGNLLPARAQVVPGSVSSVASVSQMGAFTYSIPISVPPGIRGIEPSVNITYNSQSPNGIMGSGWTVSGLSIITRTSRDLTHHSITKAVDFISDIYALDGAKLIEASPGNYKTHVNCFSRITSFGTSGTGPDHFYVETPDGQIIEYGNTPNSKLRVPGAGALAGEVYAWAISRISDRSGNYIDYIYYNDPATGETRVTQIKYGGNYILSLPTQSEINFVYGGRTDVNTSYVGGGKITNQYLLTQIEIKHAGVQVHRYDFNFGFDECSHLTSVIETGQSGATLPVTDFDYYPGSVGYEIQPTSITYETGFIPKPADFNGDGISDIFYNKTIDPSNPLALASPAGGAHPYYKMRRNDGMGSFTALGEGYLPAAIGVAGYFSGTPSTGNFSVDFDGDGKEDILTISQNSTDYYINLSITNSSGSDLAAPITLYHSSSLYGISTSFAGMKVVVGDFVGNGRKQLLVFDPMGIGSGASKVYNVQLVGISFSQVLPPFTFFGEIDEAIAVDFDGDGKHEVFVVSKGFNLTYLVVPQVTCTGNGLPPGGSLVLSTNAPGLTPVEWDYPLIGDFNGDGKSDVLFWKSASPGMPGASGDWFIDYSNTKDGFDRKPGPPGLVSTNDPGLSHTDDNFLIADFNGDGKDDIFEAYNGISSPTYRIHYSTGNNSFSIESGLTFPFSLMDDRYLSVGDFNGDGQADIFVAPWASGTVGQIVFFRKDDQRHLLRTVKKNNNLIPANGEEITVGYKALAQDYHTPTTTYVGYPFTQMYPGGIKVVKTLENSLIPPVSTFSYGGFVAHRTGLGLRGFELFTKWDIDESTQQWNNWWSFESVVPKEINSSRHTTVVLGPTPANKTHTEYVYDEDVLPPLNNKVVVPLSEVNEDYVANARSVVTYTYLPGSVAKHEFGKPDKVVTDVGYGLELTEQTITYSVTDPQFFNRNKPASIVTSKIRTGQAPISTTTNYLYNSIGLIGSFTTFPGTPHANVSSFLYDGFGNVVTETSTTASGAVANSYLSTADGRFVSQKTEPLGHITTFSYDLWGHTVSSTDINGNLTTSSYDDFGRITSSLFSGVGAAPVLTLTAYHWANAQPECPASPMYITVENTTSGILGSEKQFLNYSGKVARDVKTAFDGSLIFSDAQYDLSGNLVASSKPYVSTSAPIFSFITYDYFDRVIAEMSPVCTTYHSYSLTGTVTSPLGGMKITTTNSTASPVRVTEKEIDAAGRQLQISDGGGASLLKFTYNSSGKTIQTNSNGMVTDYVYDSYGNLTDENAPNKNNTHYVYDDRDRLLSRTDGIGNTFNYTYDLLNRVLSRNESGGNASFSYVYGASPGARGKLISESYSVATVPVASTNYSFDLSGRLTSEAETISGSTFITLYTYDANNRIDEVTFPIGNTVKYGYNSYGYRNGIWAMGMSATPLSPNTLIWRRNSVNAVGQTTSISLAQNSAAIVSPIFGSSVTVVPMIYDRTLAYTSNDFLSSDIASTASTSIKNHSYVFEEATGDLLSHTDAINAHTESFTFDDLDRLTSAATAGGPIQNMVYGSSGNLINKSDISAYDWSYDKYAVVGLPLPTTIIPTFTQTATYTPFNKIAAIEEHYPVARRIEFTYKPDEQRGVAKYYTGGVLSKTRYYSGNYEKTVEAGGAVRELCYIAVDGEPVAMFVKNGTSATQLKYILTDHLGSITHILNDAGTIDEERSYDVWGRPRNPNTWTYLGVPIYNYDRGYTGQEHLTDFNIINLNGRLYDPLIARMLSPDPYITDAENAQTYNSYSYCNNNPLKYTDKDGEWAHLAAGALIGGVYNVVSNIGSITSFPKAFTYFGIGAVGGLLTAAGGPFLGGAALGIGNSLFDQYSRNGHDLKSVDPGKLLLDGLVCGTTSYIGANAGGWLGPTMERLYGNVASPVLRQALMTGTSSTIIGYTGGFISGYAETGDLSQANSAGLTAAVIGLNTGTISGGIAGYKYARRLGVNPWSGEISKFEIDKLEYEKLVNLAKAEYPKKAGKLEFHHIDPKYMGGDPKGTTVAIDAAYHQKITNEFRKYHPYNKGKLPDGQRTIIMEKVYEKFPILGIRH